MASKCGNPHGLTDQQLVFCREYARSLHLGESYEKAGYKFSSRNVRDSHASRLARTGKIQAYLGEVLNLTEVAVAAEIAKIAFANITDVIEFNGTNATLIPFQDLSDRGKAALKSIKVKTKTTTTTRTVEGKQEVDVTVDVESEVSMHDKLAALEKLARKVRIYPKDTPVLDAVSTLADKGLLIPEQARVVKDGLCSIEEELRSLPRG